MSQMSVLEKVEYNFQTIEILLHTLECCICSSREHIAATEVDTIALYLDLI